MSNVALSLESFFRKIVSIDGGPFVRVHGVSRPTEEEIINETVNGEKIERKRLNADYSKIVLYYYSAEGEECSTTIIEGLTDIKLLSNKDSKKYSAQSKKRRRDAKQLYFVSKAGLE